MRHKFFLLLLTSILLVPGYAGESTLLLRKRVSEVRLTVVATDRENRPLPDLSPTDIAVLDDGRPVSNFELRSAGDLPLRLGILLDLSDSTQSSWPRVRKILIDSVQQAARPASSQTEKGWRSRVA